MRPSYVQIILSAVILLAAFLFGCDEKLAAQQDLKEEVIKVEDQRIQAHQNHDRAAMNRIYADDLVWTFPTGERFTKSQFVDIIANRRLKPFVVSDGKVNEVKTIKQENKHFYVFGDTVVVTRFASMEELFDGQPLPSPRRFFNVYVKKHGTWQLVTHHSAPVTKSAAP
ncbi:MAG: nuclear transport factor 2 family protein [Candidatus Sulfotelmatobacter sp.]